MLHTRIIPCLLSRNNGLVKTVKFKNPKYLGDPINIIKIFNEKEVDELILLDITATIENRPPDFDYLANLTNECFMPLCYGGGVRSIENMRTLFKIGIEKVAINTYTTENTSFIREAANEFGSQSIVVSIDVKKNLMGKYHIFTHGGRKSTRFDLSDYCKEIACEGAGEILLTSIDRDGSMAGYDLKLIRAVSDAVSIPVVACGGAGNIQHMVEAANQGGASAVAAGSLFVYQGPHRAVLINYPNINTIKAVFANNI